MARSIRQVSASSLAEEAEISAPWLSKIENNKEIPSADLIRKFSRILNFPSPFFYRPIKTSPPSDAFHFRATSRLAKRDEERARFVAVVALELTDWVETNYVVPTASVPELQDLLEADNYVSPEDAAKIVRRNWSLGSAPITNILQLLEAKGAKVFSAGGPHKSIDAFSFRHADTPLIFLNVHKTPERLRFDLAHELGHLIMHGGSLNIESGKEKEQQANDFASEFLMPREDLLGAIKGTLTLEDLLILKRRWRVSAMALNLRAYRLGILSEWQYASFARQLSRAGFRRGEPGSELTPETSSLLNQIVGDLRSQGKGLGTLANIMEVSIDDIRGLLLGLTTLGIAGGSSTSRPSRAALRLV